MFCFVSVGVVWSVIDLCLDHFDLLVRAEVTIEDYLYVHGSATSGGEAAKVEELKVARKNLETIISQHKTSSKSDTKQVNTN